MLDPNQYMQHWNPEPQAHGLNAGPTPAVTLGTPHRTWGSGLEGRYQEGRLSTYPHAHVEGDDGDTDILSCFPVDIRELQPRVILLLPGP